MTSHNPDAVIVLGGGLRGNCELPLWVVRRFERAIELAVDAPIVCLSAGTVHRPPPIDEQGYPVLESVAGARYLLQAGVPADRVQVECTSYDTIGNAYFTKLVHVDPPGWRRLIVITSEFHMPRSKAIFEWVFGVAPGNSYDLLFEATPNDGLEGDLLARRCEKEAGGLRSVMRIRESIRDSKTLHKWMFTEHGAYTAAGWIGRKAASPDIVEIY